MRYLTEGLTEGDVASLREQAGGTVEGWAVMVTRCEAQREFMTLARDEAVIRCRLAGMSWADIGAMLGITRQAASTRYGPLLESWVSSR
jgi:hypothetical protein